MRLTSLLVPIALLLAPHPSAAQDRLDPSTPSADARLESRLPAEARAPVRAAIDTARAHGLPTEPLVQKALEGASRGADATRIVRAVTALADRMNAARTALGRESSETELVAAAGALNLGVPDAML